MKASLYIESALRKEKTILKKSFCTQPFKLADVTEDGSKNILQLMVRTSSPGVLDGDELDWKIEVEEGCTLVLQTQSYQRIFQMQSCAKQLTEVRMKKGSSFTYLPHPTVPHAGSNFINKNRIYLSGDCALLWSEVITCGRKLTGEVFQFSSYHSITEIFLNDKLVVKENLLMKPSTIDYLSIGHLEGYSHHATLLFLNEQVAITGIIEKLRCCLKESSNIEYGVSALPVNGIIVRLLGQKGEQLFDCINRLAVIIKAEQSANKPTVKPLSHAG